MAGRPAHALSRSRTHVMPRGARGQHESARACTPLSPSDDPDAAHISAPGSDAKRHISMPLPRQQRSTQAHHLTDAREKSHDVAAGVSRSRRDLAAERHEVRAGHAAQRQGNLQSPAHHHRHRRRPARARARERREDGGEPTLRPRPEGAAPTRQSFVRPGRTGARDGPAWRAWLVGWSDHPP